MKKLFIGLLALGSISAFASEADHYDCKSSKLGNFKLIFVANDYNASLVDSSGKVIELGAARNMGSFKGVSRDGGKTLLTFETTTGLGTIQYKNTLDQIVCL
jgi:hypothetical protein